MGQPARSRYRHSIFILGIETFSFLERDTNRDLVLAGKVRYEARPFFTDCTQALGLPFLEMSFADFIFT